MRKILVTGMSGAGKSSVLASLQQRGHDVVDTDYDGWTIDDRLWDEERMSGLLAAPRERILFVSGTVENQVRATCTHELDTSRPLDEVVARLEEIAES